MDLQKALASTRDVFSAKRVYGEPYERDGVTVIPAAMVIGGGGGGGETKGESSGGGTGFGVFARPLGAYVIRDGRVEWEPVTDRVWLALIASGVALSALATVRLALRLRAR